MIQDKTTSIASDDMRCENNTVNEEQQNNAQDDSTDNEDIYDDYPAIRSIFDAERMLITWDEDDDKDIPGYIVSFFEHKGDTIAGPADEYHNLSSEFARKHLFKQAEYIAAVGAKHYKMNIDLLADIIKFGSQSQDWSVCEDAHRRINGIDKKRWNWRAFTFVIDYLIDRLDLVEPEEALQIEDEVKELIVSYKLIKDERAWVAESEFYAKIGERVTSIKALWEGFIKVTVVPQICTRLADMLLEDGNYDKVINVARKGLMSTAQDQPSANIGYLVYVSALAKDALIHKEAVKFKNDPSKGFNNSEMINDALLEYRIAEKLLPERRIYLDTIAKRKLILEMKSGMVDKSLPMEEVIRLLANGKDEE